MNTPRYGIFMANSEAASLLVCIDHNLSTTPTFDAMIDAASQELEDDFSGYLMFANKDDMVRDEKECEWGYYSFPSTELASQAALITAHITDEERLFTILFEALHVALTECQPLSADVAKALVTYRTIVANEAARRAAELPAGTLVYRGSQSHRSYPTLEPVPFNGSHMDARNVLLASDVDVASAKGLVEIFPMPPHLVKTHGKYWGRLKSDPKVTWMANKKGDFNAKAAVHLAWNARK